jgi:DNA-directed RNA polymerase subunit RPC12/RpoP
MDKYARATEHFTGIIQKRLQTYSGSAQNVEEWPEWMAREALHAQQERDKGCEYNIHVPSEEGYPDVSGRFYECSCGENYIDIEQAQEWKYCPHCGGEIMAKETLLCKDCVHAEWDGDDYYCENSDGKYDGDNVTDVDFDGCGEYEPRDDDRPKEPPHET